MIDLGDARKSRYYEGVLHPFYRKQSETKTVTLYLPCLDIWSAPDSRYHVKRRPNNLSMADNPFMKGVIEGVIGANPDIFSRVEKVFVEVTARYIYNKSVIDRYDFNINRIAFRSYRCVYPPRSTNDGELTYSQMHTYWKPIQELMRKIKTNHFPFFFDLNDGPDSLWLHDFANPRSIIPRHNGIVWECFAYIALKPTADPNPHDTARLRLRKFTYIPEEFRPKIPIPMKFQDRQFCTCTCKADNGVITVAARLNKFTYCQNEEIKVYIKVHNTTRRVIQRVRVCAEQVTTYDTYENYDIVTKVDSYLLNDEVKDLPILPYTEDWKVMVALKPSARRSEDKETSLEPPERNASQSPRDCTLSATSFPFEEMEKLLHGNMLFVPSNKRNLSLEEMEDRISFIDPKQYKRASDVPKNPVEGLINPIRVTYRVNVKTECPTPTLKCVRYEAPEVYLDYYLVNCEPSPANYIPIRCKEMKNAECIV